MKYLSNLKMTFAFLINPIDNFYQKHKVKIQSIGKQYVNLLALLVGASFMWVAVIILYNILGFTPDYQVIPGTAVDDVVHMLQRPLSLVILILSVVVSILATLLLRFIEKKWGRLKGFWIVTANNGLQAVYNTTAYAIAGAVGIYYMGLAPKIVTQADLLYLLIIFGVIALIIPVSAGIWLTQPVKPNDPEEPIGDTTETNAGTPAN